MPLQERKSPVQAKEAPANKPREIAEALKLSDLIRKKYFILEQKARKHPDPDRRLKYIPLKNGYSLNLARLSMQTFMMIIKKKGQKSIVFYYPSDEFRLSLVHLKGDEIKRNVLYQYEYYRKRVVKGDAKKYIKYAKYFFDLLKRNGL